MIATELPVYHDVYKFVKMVAMAQKYYSKQFKYGLGEKTLNTAIELFEYIKLANMVISIGSLIEIEYIGNVYKVKITTNGNRSSSIN